MLIEEFSFGNFRSFKDVQTLRMSAAKITSKNKELDEQNVLTIKDKTKLLKSKVIYGANASGKSNVIKAMTIFSSIIQYGMKTNDILKVVAQPFKYATDTVNEPCFFQLIFYIEGVRYRYGFEASSEKIHSEWLYITPNIREVSVFIRNEQEMIEVSKTYLTKGYDIARLKSKLLTEKILFLSMIETFGDELAEKIIRNIRSIIFLLHGDYETIDQEKIIDFLQSDYRNDILHLLQYADTGISDINLIKYTENKTFIYSEHPQYNEQLEPVNDDISLFETTESDGSQKLLQISPYILNALRVGAPIIIDEFGANLHPLLTKKIFSLYNSVKNTGSQIIVATHTTELMSSDLLRKDQIDFTEKDKYGRSYLYTLVEIKGIRNTASFENDYLEGKYGAVPFLGNWEELSKICNEPQEDTYEEE